MVQGGRYHNFNDFMDFPDPSDDPALHAPRLETIRHRVLETTSDYFKAIVKNDQMVHFPYMKFDYVQRFIEQAAKDDQVTSIKISLYRVAEQSSLTDALLTALKNNKKVTVFVEAKARFDEENNIIWGRKFEKHGATVIYSYPKIKVHSKIMLIERLEDGNPRRYAYIGTGNFNAKTSSIYCDHGLFTATKKITEELHRVFQVLQGDLIIPRAKKLLISPFSTRRKMERLIRQEMDNVAAGGKGLIQAKMNQLEDKQMIELLYKAGQAGVKIELVVRGFSCLVPGLEGISENIQMTSIVDRFLEHGRIYKFYNNGEPVMYMGSADWMERNLDRRIEVLTPILDQKLEEELDHILQLQLQDNVKARRHVEDESNPYVERKPHESKNRSQHTIYQYLKQLHESAEA
jgi:polyphosphate kinase